MIKENIEEISNLIGQMESKSEIRDFIIEILSEAELETLSKRWCILKKLISGTTQRDISKEFNVSLCKVTRGSRILKNDKSVVKKYLIKEK